MVFAGLRCPRLWQEGTGARLTREPESCQPRTDGEDALPRVPVSFVRLDLAVQRPRALRRPQVPERLWEAATVSSDQSSAQGHLYRPVPTPSQRAAQGWALTSSPGLMTTPISVQSRHPSELIPTSGETTL